MEKFRDMQTSMEEKIEQMEKEIVSLQSDLKQWEEKTAVETLQDNVQENLKEPEQRKQQEGQQKNAENAELQTVVERLTRENNILNGKNSALELQLEVLSAVDDDGSSGSSR